MVQKALSPGPRQLFLSGLCIRAQIWLDDVGVLNTSWIEGRGRLGFRLSSLPGILKKLLFVFASMFSELDLKKRQGWQTRPFLRLDNDLARPLMVARLGAVATAMSNQSCRRCSLQSQPRLCQRRQVMALNCLLSTLRRAYCAEG